MCIKVAGSLWLLLIDDGVGNICSRTLSRRSAVSMSALFAFRKRIVAHAETREIMVEKKLTGMAREEALPGIPARWCNSNLPEWGVQQILQPQTAFLTPKMRFRVA